MDPLDYILDFVNNLTLDELADYVVGDKVISDNNELAKVLLGSEELQYEFSIEEVFELFRKYDDQELDLSQLSWHLILLNQLFLRENPNDSSLYKAKQAFKEQLRCNHLDQPLPKEEVEKIRTIFEDEYYKKA